jgi:fluoride exporter
MYRVVLVALGGSLGSMARYGLAGVVQHASGVQFPWGTFAVNVVGSFTIGLVLALSLDRGLIGADLRIFLTVGFCGGFTTMSTFGYETVALLREGSLVAAFGNVMASVGTCLAAVWLGDLAARLV